MLSPLRSLLLAPLLLVSLAAAGPQEAAQSLRDSARTGDVPAVRELLAVAGAGVDAADETGWTALMYAAEAGHDDVVEALLEAGARPNLQNQAGETALHLAARHGRAASAGLLVRAGADLGLRDAEGRTALYRAIERRHADVIELLQVAAQAQSKGLMSRATLGSPEETLPPTIVESTEAPYTESARARRVEGTVVLMVLVRRDGSVGAASVSRGLEPSLDESALSTVKEWKFAPAMRGGKTVEVVLEVEVRFRLPRER
jgi:TonB family protein